MSLPTAPALRRLAPWAALGAATLVGELKNGEITEYEIHPEDFGLTMASSRTLRVETPEDSRIMLLGVLDNRDDPALKAAFAA